MSANIYLDASAANVVANRLGEMKRKTPQVLKTAVNNTAKRMREKMVEKAQEAYVVKKGRFNKAVTIKKATTRNLTAVIKATGKPMELIEFKTSPAKPPSNHSRKSRTRARVYSSSQLKPLEKNGIKAFVTQFKSGHVAIVQRRTKKRLPVKTLFSTSVPKMVGNEEKVLKLIITDVHNAYGEEVRIQLEKVIERLGRS